MFFSGADIVEVAPAYDNGMFVIQLCMLDINARHWLLAEITGIAAADLVHDFLSMFLTRRPPPATTRPNSHPKDEL